MTRVISLLRCGGYVFLSGSHRERRRGRSRTLPGADSYVRLMGAALGFVLGEVVVAAVGYSLLPRELHDSWKNPLLGVALAGALLMFVAIRLVNAHTTQIFTVVSAGAGAYLLSCGWFIRKTLVGQVAGTR